ncbi:cob(I)yrinic acid a,c-diamide adenosyltransferase [Robertmurraya massiliosenegalensis]|uniref:cob(I)yrinic acid a,c-diamide adenosyltransferase n=1 Tax=Robertmurraya TaxID=2837507 RepID=UPI0039A45BE5
MGQGMVLVYTGDGKGKTTASLGVTLRAIGRGMKVKYYQFIKSPERTYGEQIALRKLGVGFTWTKTPEEHRTVVMMLVACSSEEVDIEADKEKLEPVVINNEGFVIEYDQIPKHAVSLNQHVTEIMLTLGLEDSMVGTAYLDNEIYEPLKEAYLKVPVLSEQYPSKEEIVAETLDILAKRFYPEVFE